LSSQTTPSSLEFQSVAIPSSWHTHNSSVKLFLKVNN
jgi:hypothetical protein